MDKAIGIFDSGIGGLTVLKEIAKALPHENTVYLGDTARVPYGIKSAPTIKRYALEDAQFLISQGIKLIVVACNTASANATSFLKDRFNLPIVEVIKPGAEQAAKATRTGRIGVIGTEATIKSDAYAAQIRRINPGIAVFSKSCPLFVPLVEETWSDADDQSSLRDIKSMVVQRYLYEFRDRGIDTLVLGCTHYPLLKETIGAFMGEGVRLVDSAIETAREVVRVLAAGNLASPAAGEGNHRYFVTDAPERFRALGTRFLDKPLERVEQIDITSR